MRIERAVNYVKTLGPGSRLCIWVNGCSRNCPGCMSSRLQKADSSVEVGIEEYLEEFNFQAIDGVTVSGGEPFEQTKELVRLLAYCRHRGAQDILVYTGFTLEELKRRMDEDTERALSLVSVLIDGPYISSLNHGSGNLMGSTNQRVIFFDETLRKKYADYSSETREMQEFVLGNVLLGIGIPQNGYIEEFKNRK